MAVTTSQIIEVFSLMSCLKKKKKREKKTYKNEVSRKKEDGIRNIVPRNKETRSLKKQNIRMAVQKI